jgi:hypothetical protein
MLFPYNIISIPYVYLKSVLVYPMFISNQIKSMVESYYIIDPIFVMICEEEGGGEEWTEEGAGNKGAA